MQKIFFFLLIVVSTVVSAQTRQYTIDDIYARKLVRSTTITGFKWIPSAKAYSFLRMDAGKGALEIYAHDLETGEEKVLVNTEALRPQKDEKPIVIGSYSWSDDGKRILITGTLTARTVKTGGAFFVYDCEKKKIVCSVESDEEQKNIEFSPNGKLVSFVRGNNLFVLEIATKKITKLTKDGSEVILNGAFDWVYEEEFSIITAYSWSPDSKAIAFWRFDQSNVPRLAFQTYDSLYLSTREMRYPKAGAKNSTVKIGVIHLDTKETAWMDIGSEQDIYIPRMQFTRSPQQIVIQRLDRLQQHLELLLADTKTGRSSVLLEERDSAWVEVHDNLVFLKDNSFVWQSHRNNYNHCYLYRIDGSLMYQLTDGKYEVTNVHAVDEADGLLYYTSNERGVLYDDFYSVRLNGTDKKLLTPEAGFHTISLAPDFGWYTDAYSNSRTPEVTSLYKSGAKVRELTTVSNNLSQYDLGESSFFTLSTTQGYKLQGYMIKPANFDSTKRYPVLFYNYSGPGSQIVYDKWDRQYLWHQLLAQRGYIIVQIDNRGTGNRGKDFRNLVYKKLGTLEVEDFIEAAKYFGSLPYVDKSRIGIWGWSFGGYMSAITLLKGADYFKTAIAVAPVTDWRFYDDIYTERYMSLPELNKEGYDNASVLSHTGQLKGKLLLVHGTADDNVHFQNSVKLAEKLIQENKQFRTMFYPEKEHSIYGGKTRQHLFTMLTEFILAEL